MKNKTLKQILDNIKEEAYERYGHFVVCSDKDNITIQEFIQESVSKSIKDALEAVRVENIDQVELPNGRIVDEAKFRLFGKHMMIKGYNQCTTQYDENVKKFLGEE